MATDDEVEELQAELDRSWEAARQANDRPGFRARLEASVYDVRELPADVLAETLRSRRDPRFQDWVAEQAMRLNAASA